MTSDLPTIVGIAAGCSVAVAVVGSVLARLVRARPIWVWFSVVVAVTVGCVAAGVTAAAEDMFVSDHDLQVILLVLAVSGVVATVNAVLLARPAVAAADALRAAAHRLGGEDYRAVTGAPSAQFSGIAEELTATHQRLVAAREREQAVERSRRDLVAWVSHDLRTPLAGIRAMAEALEDGIVADRDEVARYHTQMRQDADRLAAMVDDLFELARVNSGALRLSPSRVPLADLVSDAVAVADPIARAKGVVLRGGVAPEQPVEVDVDVGEVGRVLTNLLVNAIRYTPGEGTVEVAAGGHARTAFVTVRDACGGIPPGDLDRIFETGYRGEAARPPHDGLGTGPGAGLGLAIARGIVEAHDGDIAVNNTADGCRFVVTLPAAV